MYFWVEMDEIVCIWIGVYFNQSIKIIVFHASTNGVSDLVLHINYWLLTPEGPDDGQTGVGAQILDLLSSRSFASSSNMCFRQEVWPLLFDTKHALSYASILYGKVLFITCHRVKIYLTFKTMPDFWSKPTLKLSILPAITGFK